MGYPSGLTGETIPLPSALIAVTDTFDALTSDRPYRKAPGLEKALYELNRCRCTQFDPRVVDAFVEVVHREQNRGDHAGQGEECLISLRPALAVN